MKIRNQSNLFPQAFRNEIEGEWDFTGEDTQYLTHSLHPYLASMIPQIPRKLLAIYANHRTHVLDPFVGGGSVLVESYLANVASTGIDVNPLAVIISKAKTTPIAREVLIKALRIFDEVYSKIESSPPLFPESAKMDYWFKPYMFEPLARIRTALHEVTVRVGNGHNDSLKNLLACVFSDTVRDVSLTYRGEVRLRRLQGKDLEQFNPDVLSEFKKRFNYAISCVSQLPIRNKIPHVYEGDSRKIQGKDGRFDLVITSPPYGDIKNTIPYHQFSKNMLYWLGSGEAALTRIRESSLGAQQKIKQPPPSNSLQQALEQMHKPKLIHEAICFYSDYYNALTEIARVTSQRIIIVIGHRILDAVLFDNPTVTTELMREIGWRLETKYERAIRKKRINRKMGFGHNAQGGTIDTESILVYVPGR